MSSPYPSDSVQYRQRPTRPPPSQSSGRHALSSARFEQLLDAVEARSSVEEQLGVVRRAAMDHWFTVGQVVMLMDSFKFGKDQVEVAAVLYDARLLAAC